MSLDRTCQQLDRHETRRRAGTPTPSLLLGPAGLGVAALRRWARARPLAFAREPEQEAALRAFVEATLSLPLERLAAHAIEPVAGMRADEILARCARASVRERTLLLRRIVERSDRHVAAAARALLDRGQDDAPLSAGELLDRLRVEDGSSSERDGGFMPIAALQALLPAGDVPVLVFAFENGRSTAWMSRVARVVTGLADHVPTLPIAVVGVTAPVDAGEHRGLALLRAAELPLEPIPADAILQALAARVSVDDLGASMQRLARDGADEALVELFSRAAVASADPGADDDKARSAAERFLYARLESLAWSSGRFVQNGGAGFRFGSRQAEVDLLCGDLGIAIEIDGYHHFKDVDGYRRDRRKDFELQTRGFLVLRFLATDVVACLETILDTIESAVALRSARP